MRPSTPGEASRSGRTLPSIHEVARRAGVSPTTVSHALSGRRPVNEETASRVRAVVAELGYVPTTTARNLRTGRTAVLGLIVPDIANEFFSYLARGAEDAAHDQEYALLMSSTGFDAAREDRALDLLRSRVVDGLIYAAGSRPSRARLGSLVSSFPVALADEEVPGLPGALIVTSDHRAGGRLAGAHLRQGGHSEALVVSGPVGLASSDERVQGFLEHLPGAHVLTGDFRAHTGAEAIKTALARGLRFSAVFALNDLMAIGVIGALTDAGLRVPEDVSVVGFDDIELAARMAPALTTVRQSAYDIGHTAARQLLVRIAERQPSIATRTVLPVELVVRGSTAPFDPHRQRGSAWPT